MKKNIIKINWKILGGKLIEPFVDHVVKEENGHKILSYGLGSYGYDIRLSTYFSPNGDDLSDSPRIRSMFQKAIGEQNLELKLNKLADSPKILASLDQMNQDIRNGLRGDYETGDYYHNIQIDRIFTNARRKAWASIMSDPRIRELVRKQKEEKIRRYKKKQQTVDNLHPILQMYK